MSGETLRGINPIPENIKSFLAQHGVGGTFEMFPLRGGANNQVYRIARGGGDWVLKSYFQNPADPRDRFGAERAFYEFIWSNGLRGTPQPIAWCDEQRLGLFTFVPGRKLNPEEVNEGRVREALGFLAEINAGRMLPEACKIPAASEACFTPAEHLACIDRRVARLESISAEDEIGREAFAFARDELKPAWERIRAAIVDSGSRHADQPQPREQRCLSPSDFGFHNAVLAPDGRLRFFDFEYAGWDDPAKLICDFFCQPELSAGLEHWNGFVNEITSILAAPESLHSRARSLLPAYQIKWCCIMLNEFLRSEQARRAFSIGEEKVASRKAAQLEKARKLFFEQAVPKNVD